MKTEYLTVPIYIGTLIVIHTIYLAVFLGIFTTVPNFVNYLNIGIQTFLCLFLMIRFHPFREKYILKPADTMFIFGSAFLLFTNLVLVEFVQIPRIGNTINSVLSKFGKETGIKEIQIVTAPIK